jgi:hypothetical protein
VTRRTSGAAAGALLALLLLAGWAAAARGPSPAERHGIVAALRGQQGNVAIERIKVSSTSADYASIDWGFANNGYSALNDSVLARSDGAWRVLWTREREQRGDGACIYVPAPVVRELLRVSCPSAASLRGRRATAAELAAIEAGFRTSGVTPYAPSSRLRRVCVSRLDPRWAAAAAVSEVSGVTTFVWFRQGTRWAPTFDSISRSGAPPPAVVLSLASCVGYNPADYGG